MMMNLLILVCSLSCLYFQLLSCSLPPSTAILFAFQLMFLSYLFLFTTHSIATDLSLFLYNQANWPFFVLLFSQLR